MPFAFDAIFVGVWKCGLVNFIMLGLVLGLFVTVRSYLPTSCR